MMDAERFRELCIEHVLDGLEGEDLAEFRAELEARGEAGRRELDRVREALGSVALGAPRAVPSPGLRDRVLRRVRSEADLPSIDPSVRPSSRPGAAGGPPRRWWPAAAAVAALAAVGLGVWNARLQERLADREAALDSARARLAGLDSLAGRIDTLEEDVRTLASPRGLALALTGTEASPEASARVFVDPATGRALLFAYELPILPPDSVYQLWAIRGEEPVSAGTFTATGPGPARLELEDSDAVAGADALAVTVEPAPGRPAPTGAMVLLGAT